MVTAAPFSQSVYMHILLIDKGFCEAKMYCLSCAIIFLNVSTIFYEISSLFIRKICCYFYFYFCDICALVNLFFTWSIEITSILWLKYEYLLTSKIPKMHSIKVNSTILVMKQNQIYKLNYFGVLSRYTTKQLSHISIAS